MEIPRKKKEEEVHPTKGALLHLAAAKAKLTYRLNSGKRGNKIQERGENEGGKHESDTGCCKKHSCSREISFSCL